MTKSNIYTRTGDRGMTSLYNGDRLVKNDIIFTALGDLDELNSYIGLITSYLNDVNMVDFNEFFSQTQHILIDVGSYIATPRSTSSDRKIRRTEITEEYTDIVETHINRMDNELPKLTTFILPGGSVVVSHIHVCRSICRRTERSILSLRQEDVSDNIRKYINRLSDFFFVLARYVNHKCDNTETIHKK